MALSVEKEEEIHVLLVAFSAVGHLNPMLRLGNRLASKGLRVTLATTEIARQNLLQSTTDPNIQIRLEFFSDGLSLDYDRKSNLDDYMDTLSKFGPQNLSNLIENLSDNRHVKFSCIINNPFVPWVADVASQHGIPCAMLWIQPCALYAIYYRFCNQLNRFPTLTDSDMSVELPGLPLLHTQDLPSFVLPSNPFGSFTKLFLEMFKNMEKLKWVLGNSFYELEKDVVESMSGLCPIRPIGPLVPPMLLGKNESNDIGADLRKPEESCIKWLDEKPHSSVIYVSFGSISVLSAKQMENLALGLKNSNRPFLWVVSPSDYGIKDGEGNLLLGLMEEMEEGQGLVVQWCPQTKVLMHPAISCFITHCGWNSTLETVASGVPVIAFPQWTDQPTNAKLVADVFGMGLRLRPDEDGLVSKEEVKRSIAEITVGPNSELLKKNAIEWKAKARKAVADGGSSDRNIQMFIDEIIGQDSTRSVVDSSTLK